MSEKHSLSEQGGKMLFYNEAANEINIQLSSVVVPGFP